MRDMYPRKQTTSVTEIKKGLKDSVYGNGATSASPSILSPATSGGSPAQDGTKEGLNMKPRSDSPRISLKNNNEDKLMNSSSNCIGSMMPKPLTPAVSATMTSHVTSPISSPGIMPVNRKKPSPKNKRRNPDMKQKNQQQIFEFEGQNSAENFCTNNNNSKQSEKAAFALRRSKVEEIHTNRRTPSTNSVSDELSSSGLTPTTDEHTNNETSDQNLDLFDDDMIEAMKIIDKDSFPDPGDDLPDLVVTSGSLDYPSVFPNTTESFLFGNTRSSPTLDGVIGNLGTSPPTSKQSTVTSESMSLASSSSPPTFPTDAKFSSPESRGKSQMGAKSHLQDILGVTDTIRLKNMSRSIDSVPYKSPTTTTSYSTGVKPPNPPCTMAPPNRLPSNLHFNKPARPQYNMYNDPYRTNPGFNMDMGTNGPWNRGSPRHIPPNLLKQPPYSAPSSISPTGMNPMSQLQSTVDSIPAAPIGTEMGPPLRSPLGFETPSPGSGKMRPPPSPSVTNDKRCVSADSITSNTTNSGKKTGNKRERTKSADSRDEDKKDNSSGPKPKRKKSKSKDDNTAKKEGKTPGRSTSKEEKLNNSVLSGLLNAQTNNPYLYIFNTEAANNAANDVRSNKVPDIILFHQSFLGNCKLGPSQRPSTSVAPFERPTNSDPINNITMPRTNRSPTEISAEKGDALRQKSPKTEIPQGFPENIQAINLQDTKPPMLPPPASENHDRMIPNIETSQPSVPATFNGDQELTEPQRRDRQNKLGKIREMRELLLTASQEDNAGNNAPRGPGWPGNQQPQLNYGPMVPMEKGIRPGMKPMTSEMLPGQPMTQENAEWFQLLQEHNAKKGKRQDPGELPSRPPPPYGMNGPPHRWVGPEGYTMEPRMPMEAMNPRFQRMGPGHRPMTRMPQDPRYMGHRMGVPRGAYPPGQNPRMQMYEPYMGQPGMRPPGMVSRLPPPGMRQPTGSENYPFSEQLMKQASFYNSVPYEHDPGPGMAPDWAGSEGTTRLSHMPGSASPVLGPQGMMGAPMDMEPQLTPGVPTPRGYDPMGAYPPSEMQQRYDMMPCPMGSPTGPVDARMRGPAGVGSMMDAIARRGGQRPPDLNLNSQIPPRSPMYPGQGPLQSPSVNAMNPGMGPRYSNPGDMGHPPQPSPMHPRSPAMGMGGMRVGSASAGVEPPQVMLGGGPHSAGPMSNAQPSDWPGPNPNMAGPPTPNPGMMHHSMMTSQPGNMTSQPGMMASQPGMMMQQQQGMMSSPAMMAQPGMMTSQGMMTSHRMSNPQLSKMGQSTISIMENQVNSFKMPEKTPLYQDAVKDTASPPPLTHANEPPPLTHNPMPGGGGMRMPGPGHPPNYDPRMGGHPRMGVPVMNENYPPQGYPGQGSHPSPMGQMMMPHMGPESMPPSEFQHRSNYPEVATEFDLRGILPSDKPSQTISYLPPESNDQFQPPNAGGWAPDGIRPMSGPMYPSGPNNRPLI